ncbi:hypothetical protein [Paenibacillus terrigena]|uniref:hypothetical protein n=1 Tax=Paenibacillus terrigena TaxID=369333 RepID=UPI0028D323C7|nr:hypothetical protein [Paenibacillus terrigena]
MDEQVHAKGALYMRLIRPILLACAGSLLVTLMISLLVHGSMQPPRDHKTLPVFSEAAPIDIHSNNLVDVLEELPLQMHIGRVVWSGTTLTLDLNVGNTPDAAQDIYTHMQQIILFSFTQTTNVKQLFLRFVTPDDGSTSTKRLLLAVDASRDDWDRADLEMLRALTIGLSPEVKDKLHLRYTALWNKKFGSTD